MMKNRLRSRLRSRFVGANSVRPLIFYLDLDLNLNLHTKYALFYLSQECRKLI